MNSVWLKGWVQYFSIQVFSPKFPKIIWPDPSCRFRKTHTLIPKNDVTKPKVRLL